MGRHSRHLRGFLNTVLDLMTESEYLLDQVIIRACMAKNERAMICIAWTSGFCVS